MPFGPVIVPRVPVMPLPATGVPVTVSGGHTVRHGPVHVDWFIGSDWRMYSVMLLASTTCLPYFESLATLTVAPAADPPELEPEPLPTDWPALVKIAPCMPKSPEVPPGP